MNLEIYLNLVYRIHNPARGYLNHSKILSSDGSSFTRICDNVYYYIFILIIYCLHMGHLLDRYLHDNAGVRIMPQKFTCEEEIMGH
jgi:hypothetical protein